MNYNLQQQTVANRLSGALFGYAFAALAAFFVLLSKWNEHAPRLPSPASGSVLPHNEHGAVTYFTAFQATSCALLFASAAIAFLLSMAIGPKKNIQTRRLGKVPVAWTWSHDDPHELRKEAALWGATAAVVVVFAIGPNLVAWLNSAGVILPF